MGCLIKFKNRVRSILDTLVTKYLQWRGYLGSDLEPLKCPYCRSNDIEECNEDFGGYNIPDGTAVEFDIRCKNCGEILGHFAYGNWDVR